MLPHRGPAAPAAAPGFTLLELVIALAVTVILLAMAVPSLGARAARQRLVAAGRDLAADLVLARHESAQRGRPVHLVFHPGVPWCWAVALAEASDCAAAPLDGRPAPTDPLLLRAVQGRDRPGIELLDAAPFIVDLRAGAVQPSLGHAEFRAASGEVLRVTMSPIGRASVCATSGTLPGVPHCADVPAP